MENKDVLYRVNADWIWEETDDIALSVSDPAYSLEQAMKLYEDYSKEFCVDDKTKHAKVSIERYALTPTGRYKTKKGRLILETILKNY